MQGNVTLWRIIDYSSSPMVDFASNQDYSGSLGLNKHRIHIHILTINMDMQYGIHYCVHGTQVAIVN